jgi:hypothetical protein
VQKRGHGNSRQLVTDHPADVGVLYQLNPRAVMGYDLGGAGYDALLATMKEALPRFMSASGMMKTPRLQAKGICSSERSLNYHLAGQMENCG